MLIHIRKDKLNIDLWTRFSWESNRSYLQPEISQLVQMDRKQNRYISFGQVSIRLKIDMEGYLLTLSHPVFSFFTNQMRNNPSTFYFLSISSSPFHPHQITSIIVWLLSELLDTKNPQCLINHLPEKKKGIQANIWSCPDAEFALSFYENLLILQSFLLCFDFPRLQKTCLKKRNIIIIFSPKTKLMLHYS